RRRARHALIESRWWGARTPRRVVPECGCPARAKPRAWLEHSRRMALCFQYASYTYKLFLMTHETREITVGKAVIDAARANGMTTIFGVPGAQIYPLFDGL